MANLTFLTFRGKIFQIDITLYFLLKLDFILQFEFPKQFVNWERFLLRQLFHLSLLSKRTCLVEKKWNIQGSYFWNWLLDPVNQI